MIATRHYINNQEVYPDNGDDVGFKLDFTADWKEAEINVDSLVFSGVYRNMIMQHIQTIGVFEGIPYTIQLGTLNLDYYIDLSSNVTISDSTIEVNVKRRKAVDKFMQDADGLTFELLNTKILISGIFNVPYIVVKDNQAELLIMLGISTFMLVKELQEGIKELVIAATDVVRAATPNVGVPPSIDLGDIIAAAIMAVARLLYVLLIIIALIQLITQIVELILPKVRYLKGNTFRSLIAQGCSYLGYSFSSTIQQMDATCLPVPLLKENKSIYKYLLSTVNQSYNKGYPTASDSVSTLGEMIRVCAEWLNAEWRIINGVFHIERRDYWRQFSGNTITNTLSVQDRREDSYTFNLDEAWKRYYLHYEYDASDTHTMDNFTGIAVEYSTEPVTVINSDLVSIKGLAEKAIPLSHGARKNELNYVEKELYKLAVIADSLVNFFGGSSAMAAKVVNRVGVLQVSQQYFTRTKVMWTIGGKQPTNYLDYIGANAIYTQYHSINQVKENFKRVYQSTIPFSPSQFLQLLNNNFVLDQFGMELEILTFEWTNEAREATINYLIQSSEGNNTKTILING